LRVRIVPIPVPQLPLEAIVFRIEQIKSKFELK
jgi:hypothetical protein